MIKLKHILQEGVDRDMAAILKLLHKYSNRVKFSIEDVNGRLNIVYDDPSNLTQDVLKQLRDRKFWNTDVAPAIGRFENGRVNITFPKSAQDILKIQDFDKMDWDPKKG